MQRLTIDEIEPWLLSGTPVVRLQGRDFGTSVTDYADWFTQLCAQLKLGVEYKYISDPPGVVLQAYLPDDPPPVLTVPIIKVSKTDTPFLFCIYHKCRNRVEVPGSECGAH